MTSNSAPTNKDSTDELCVFCNLDNIKCVTELTKDVVMFEPLNPVVEGHVLFVHRQHTEHAGRNPKISAVVFEQASKYAGEQARPFNIITSGGKDATQTVFHLHIHYVPRRKYDGLLLPWSDIQRHYTRQEAVTKHMVASSLLLHIGPLAAQAAQAGDEFPLQTRESIDAAFKEIKELLAKNKWSIQLTPQAEQESKAIQKGEK